MNTSLNDSVPDELITYNFNSMNTLSNDNEPKNLDTNDKKPDNLDTNDKKPDNLDANEQIIPRYIAMYDDFLSAELYEECYKYAIDTYLSNDMVFKTNKSWNNNIVYDSTPIIIHTPTDQTNNNLCKKIRAEILNKTGLSCKFKDLHFYFFTPMSHIPWHDDHNHDGGITIYLNKEWHENTGGAFMYKNDESINAIYPRSNTANLVVGDIFHCVCSTTKNSDTRMTIQCFFDL